MLRWLFCCCAAQRFLRRSPRRPSVSSVPTRLPPPHRGPGPVVTDFLRARFPQPFLRLSERRYRGFVLRLAEQGITGGAAYDALGAATAAAAGAELVTCDRRAAGVYDAYGIRFRMLGHT